MKLFVISPEADDSREHAVLESLVAAGLEQYHVRKPGWSVERLEQWLAEVSVQWRSRLVLHEHHELVEKFELGGRHGKDDEAAGSHSQLPKIRSHNTERAHLLSRSCHDLDSVKKSLGRYDAVFLSPIFPSISKVGYLPKISHHAIAALLQTRTELERRTAVIALGGITPRHVANCRQLGFDGIAAMGSLWSAEDPVSVFSEFQSILYTHAT